MAPVGIKGLKIWSYVLVRRLAKNIIWRHSIRWTWWARKWRQTGETCPGHRPVSATRAD